MIRICRILIIIITFSVIICCDKDKSPTIYIPNIDMQYVEAWPQILISEGIGYPDLSLTLPQQRAGALKEAKIIALSMIYFQIECFQINSSEYITNIVRKKPEIKVKIREYIDSTYRLLDTRYMSDGSVEIDISLATDSIFSIIKE